ncbi:phasin family protein [Paraburkholderia ginsengisoli]|uniref:Phasin family protein n=1 Tax=Paraburkholderia ginsengisoli TaxID=311231 RepID=A0A7T4N7W9_9BURK|nr:phasin family protein [Paraburkholderia ginsengisoli]QQC66940.1 phasin family protein [Paraburkholderia ginsengisoli]
MYSDIADQFSSRQRDTVVETAFDCNTEIFSGVARFVELNLQTVKTSLSEQQALADAALSAQSLSEVIDLQSQRFPAAIKKSFAYWRHVEDIAAQTRIGLFTAMQSHFDNSLNTFTDIVETASAETVAQEQSAESSLLVTSEPVVAAAEQVAIVDSSGKVVSSGDGHSDLH